MGQPTERYKLQGENRICSSCTKVTPRFGVYCVHCHNFLPADPKTWAVAVLVLAPFAICAMLGAFHSPLALFWPTALILLVYVHLASKEVRHFYYLYPLYISVVIFGISLMQIPYSRDLIAASLGLLFLILVYYLFKSVKFWQWRLKSQEAAPRIEIVIAVVLLSLSLYYWLYDVAKRLGILNSDDVLFGILQPGDFLFPLFQAIARYEHWYWVARVLLLVSVAACWVIAAANKMSKSSATQTTSRHSIFQVAELAAQFFKELKTQTMRIIEGVLAVQIGFACCYLLPWLLSAACAYWLLTSSRWISEYLIVGYSEAWKPIVGAVITVLLLYLLIFISYVATVLWRPAMRFPPYYTNLRPFMNVVQSDVVMLVFHVSYSFSLASLLAFALRFAGVRFLLPAVLGIYFWILISICVATVLTNKLRQKLTNRVQDKAVRAQG